MRRILGGPVGHVFILTAATAVLSLPNLGGASLWDLDEGLNAEAAREMLESGNWVVPTFNFQLRSSKPALLYWCQALAFRAFGVNEFAARLPSALAGWAAVLATYFLGRRMFGAGAALIGALILASTVQVVSLAHAATPDALLLAATAFTFCLFWGGYARGSVRWARVGAGLGLATLAKGPVGLVLPAAAIGLFLVWDGGRRQVLRRGFLLSWLTWALVALPWYVLVSLQTRGEFARNFFTYDNLNRFLHPLDTHSGPVYYYLPIVLVGFLPWTAFLPAGLWHSLHTLRRPDSDSIADARSAIRLLTCWAVVILVCFSVAATKLPNYVAPLYPAVALVTGRFLERWRVGAVRPAWWGAFAPAALGLLGVAVSAAILVYGGAIDLPPLRGRTLDGLASRAWVGVVPIVGALFAAGALWRGRRTGVVISFATAACALVALLAVLGPEYLEGRKAPKSLVAQTGALNLDQEIRIGTVEYTRPSLVFYCQREVADVPVFQSGEFLASPLPVYLFVPIDYYEVLRPNWTTPYRPVARHFDMYLNKDIIAVTNR